MDLQGEVARLQQNGLEKSTRMQETLQMWSQWEEDSSWSDSLLRHIETSFPKMHEGGDYEEHLSEKLSVYQELRGALDRNKARFDQMLEAGLWLREAGCRGVGVSTTELEVRWRVLNKKVEDRRSIAERSRKLTRRFLRDSAVLAGWMGGAKEMIDRWRHLSVSVEEEVDVEQSRDDYVQCLTLIKDLEARSDLKASVIGAGAQLVHLREAAGDSDGNKEDEEASDSDLCFIHSQLRQIELDWSGLHVDVPVVQQTLHKRWIKTLSQQGALQELQAWVEEHHRRINETSGTNTEPSQILKYSKECRAEMSARQATLDFVNQQLLTCSTEESQWGRYEDNQFAEEQGCLNHQWLSLQETLNSQVQTVEQKLRSRAEQEAQLQQISSWISEQNLWMDSAQRPSSLTELQRSISTCRDLKEKIRQKSAALQQLRDKPDGGGENIAGTDESIQACEDLTQQNETVKQRLIQAQQLWLQVQKQLNQLKLKTIRTSQTLEHHSCPQISLQAHRDLHEKLQLLHEETEASDSELDELSRTVSSLRDVVSPAAAVLLAEQLDGQRDR